MVPRTKRPRSNSVSQSQASNEVTSTNSKPAPHNVIWFEDGSTVLATTAHLYRVHKGILAKNSSFFKDMFDFPTSGEQGETEGAVANAEQWKGVPLVRMIGDSDEDVYHLLMALYDREYHQVNEPTTLPIILALLEMSTKYDFQAIRREVIQHLSLYYTTHPESAPHMRLFAEDQDVSKDANFRLLAAARRCNVRSILPMLFYVCSIEPLDTIFEQSNQLNPEDFKRLISGRETLITRIKNFGRTMLQPCMKCGNDLCFDTRARMHLRWINCEYTPNVFPLGAISGGIKGMGKSEEYPQLCRTCVDESSVRLHFFRTGFCGSLPRIFNLGNWGDLEDDDLETESESESP